MELTQGQGRMRVMMPGPDRMQVTMREPEQVTGPELGPTLAQEPKLKPGMEEAPGPERMAAARVRAPVARTQVVLTAAANAGGAADPRNASGYG